MWEAHQAGIANNSWSLWRWLSLNQWLALRNAFAAKAAVSGEHNTAQAAKHSCEGADRQFGSSRTTSNATTIVHHG